MRHKQAAAVRPTASSYKLVIVAVSDRFFLSHFLDRALYAQRAGYEVTVVAPDTGSAGQIRQRGFGFVHIDLERHNVNPVPELRTIWQLKRIYNEQRPSLVWHIGIKPIVLGTLAVILSTPETKIVNAPVGLGYVFAGEDRKARLIRPLLRTALRRLLNPLGSVVIFENQEDLSELQHMGALRRDHGVVIYGAGVDLAALPPLPEPNDGPPTVLLAARMIEEKGIRVYVEAARVLQQRGRKYQFLLAGGVDHQHSAAIPETDLRSWHASGLVHWLGDQQDMSAVISRCHVFCLPTWHREGIPKVLLEAMATRRAIITTDVVGCRELIHHRRNGWIVPPRDPVALAEAIDELLEHGETRRRLANAALEDARHKYATEIVCRKTLRVFKSLVPLTHVRQQSPGRRKPIPKQDRWMLQRKILCIIPSYNGREDLRRLLHSLEQQDLPHETLVIDSSSTDGTVEMLGHGFPGIRVQVIPQQDFGHGKTRQWAFFENPDYDFYVYLTQDAYFCSEDSLRTLLHDFQDGQIGAICGRQIAHLNATVYAAFSREFNYPAVKQRRCLADRERLGIKTAFLSDSCSAYRGKALLDVGGFPDVAVSEDLYVGAKLLLGGWCIGYPETPICYHSHNYTLRQEFRRYRAIGAFHGQQRWIHREFGGAGGEGMRYVLAELRYLGLHRFWQMPISLIRNSIKFIAFRTGQISSIRHKNK